MGFVHLHVHSHLSLLDATIRVDKLVDKVKALGMNAVALTDHGNVFGAVQLLKACKKAEIKPIFGSEVLVADKRQAGRFNHLVLLCRNPDGFASLRNILSLGYTEGLIDSRPTVTRETLARYNGGLIALSACLGGEIPQALLRGDEDTALEALDFYRTTYGDDSFYLELEGNDLAEQAVANRALIDLGRRTGTPLVATNNAHYLEREDAVAHAVLVAIELKRQLNEEQRRNLPVRSFHLATPDEMAARFADVPDALENTVKIAESIEPKAFKTSEKLHFPIFQTPQGETTADYLRALSAEGCEKRIEEARRLGNKPDPEAYRARLEIELGVIIKLGFDAYYLIVWDFINWAKANGVPVGPGRGSGAGSLVAFAIGITDIDPIRFDLLFERFLNPERVSPPDFDVDFCMEKRDRVYQYVIEKYGRERVGQIITYGSLKAKAVVRDVARVMGFSFAEGDRIAKLIPNALDMTLDKALGMEAEIPKLLKEDPRFAELWDVARRLEGLNRQAGKHAAGVVIADLPITEYAPLYVDDEGAVVTQFNMKDLDAVGLIKFDFLGLTALTVTQNAVDMIRARGNPDFRVEDVPIDDAATYQLMCQGGTAGVFQLETRGITDLVKRLQPDCIDDIIATIALFRPGPLGSGMVDDFVDRKHGVKAVEYLVPLLEPILKDTYGTILYQEQIMLVAQHLGGFTLGGADLLRRAMGKKDKKVLEEQRVPFLDGAKARNIDPAKAGKLFEIMEHFAEYGFNKSHSAAYALVTYRMAYLKTHYPTEFLCAVLTAEKGDQNKVMRFIHEARDMGISALPPDVQRSGADFTVEDVTLPDGTRKGAIRFGLSAVKGIGNAVVDAILAARADGPFDGLIDFLARVDLRRVNKRALEALVKCGSMDRFGYTRASMTEGLDKQIEFAQNRKAEKDSGQIGLFDMVPVRKVDVAGPPAIPEWPMKQILAGEKETLGYYLSGHPLDPYKAELQRYQVADIADVGEMNVNTEVSVAGIVIGVSEKLSKTTQQKFAYVTLEDTTGQVECFVGTRTHEQWAAVAGTNDPLLVKGKVKYEGDNEDQVRILVDSVQKLDVARRSMVKSILVKLDLSTAREATVDALRDLFKRTPGHCPVTFEMRLAGVGELHLRAGSNWTVDPTETILADIEQILGPGTAQMG